MESVVGSGGGADILAVDDTPANLRVLSDMLAACGLRVRLALSGPAALLAAAAQAPDLILLDVMMPGMDGYEVCTRLKESESLRDVPVIFLSALDETTDKIKAFAVGGVDYITKPFQIEEVQARVDTHLRLHRLQVQAEEYGHSLEEVVESQVKEISDSQMATIFALARLAESRDGETGRHLERVRTYCGALAERLAGHPEHGFVDREYVLNVVNASPLHDIGKVAISDAILLKPGPLTAEEFEVIKTHTVLGAETLEAVAAAYPRNAFVAMGIDIARSHHERWDGTGYPDGLVGMEIPLCSRIMAVVDVYDALRSKRVYKPAIGHAESRDIILSGAGTQFDPLVVCEFEALADDFEHISESIAD